MTEMAEGQHVLDGGDCWCGALAGEYERDRAAGVVGRTPTSHLLAIGRQTAEERVSRHRDEVAAAYNAGRADERRAVVAWLRVATAETGAPAGALPLIHDLADAIERGEHRA